MDPLFALTLSAFLLAAAANDIVRYEIPNGLCLALAGAFAPLAYAAGLSPPEVGVHYAVGFALLILGFGLFQLGAFGGGDAKLIAAAGVWFGLPGLSPFLLALAIAGGVLAAAALIARRAASPAPHRPPVVNRFLEPTRGVPYAVAIAAGALIALPQVAIF